MVTKQDYEAKARNSQKLAYQALEAGDEWLVNFHQDMQAFWLSMASMRG